MNVGDAVPALERTITLTDMVAYAGATWDWHRLHYDQAFVSDRGIERPVVDGQMLGALMAKHLMDHAGPGAFITTLEFRLRAMVTAGSTVRVEGAVTSIEDGHAHFEQRVLVGDTVAAEGIASVRV